MFNPSQYHALTAQQADLISNVMSSTKKYFQHPRFDASHDFTHVLRVTAIAIQILEEELHRSQTQHRPYDAFIVILGAIMHDVGDKKYPGDGVTVDTAAYNELIRLGVEEFQAQKVQNLIGGVSYSAEVKDPQRVRDLLINLPELAIVQDADRLDALGAVGLGRAFAYGAAKTSRSLAGSIDHTKDKLFKLDGMMKTQTGQRLAVERTARMRQFSMWWREEVDFASSLP